MNDGMMESFPLARSSDKDMPGWKEHVELECERSLFWHWIWLEVGEQNNGTVYDVMGRARHRYHYEIHGCKRQKCEI